ncbi:MAG: hypothetical protein LBE82_02335 [Chitinophagaceae bacterium]|nr:hypothetical protein [Chitinophagaceae bacterium]
MTAESVNLYTVYDVYCKSESSEKFIVELQKNAKGFVLIMICNLRL